MNESIHLIVDCAEPVTDIREASYVASINIEERQGPPGPAGNSLLGDKPVSIHGLATNDLLRYDGAAWTNTPQVQLTDGGNF